MKTNEQTTLLFQKKLQTNLKNTSKLKPSETKNNFLKHHKQKQLPLNQKNKQKTTSLTKIDKTRNKIRFNTSLKVLPFDVGDIQKRRALLGVGKRGSGTCCFFCFVLFVCFCFVCVGLCILFCLVCVVLFLFLTVYFD